MARTWLSVAVELLGGRGDELWPWPGRVLAVGPDHTFAQLAAAINDAFARWDRSHLSEFTLSDGRLVTDVETGEELSEEEQVSWLDLAQTRVAGTVRPGEEFRFTFDLGDQWVHRCVVGQDAIDPVAELGVKPPSPLPYWGWGTIPDQYGRRWADDDGTSRAATRPAQAHPMLGDAWPGRAEAPLLDMGEVRAAIAQGDAAAFLAAVAGRDIDDALQQVGEGVPMALATDRAAAEPLARTVIARLEDRAAPGDDVLAEDLAAAARGQAPGGRVLPVDLDQLSSVLEGDPSLGAGGVLDLQTGEVHPDGALDASMVGDEYAIDVEEDPDRWLPVDCHGSRSGWQDMAAFARRHRDVELRERLERALEGRGGFRRFRDLVHEEGLGRSWGVFSADRQAGRARQWLADEGIRVR
ncbi:IS1096 element passenger TnpR family protein [Janibacter anophelis]|uniref:IS1096 element passenger TnpR family protein n=1 Tax=Janibacter anophelis TaxID=319054 RepID=UPI000830FD16|nr:hypothetical protein [Janibacter anophelis]